MVRSRWIAAWAGVFTLAGLALGNSPCAERVIELQEPGKPVEKCKVLRCWQQKDGHRACQVQSLNSGEIMTILDLEPLAAPCQSCAGAAKRNSRIFHWGSGKTSPALAPPVPADAVVVGECADCTPKPAAEACPPCVCTGTVTERAGVVPAMPAPRPSLLDRMFRPTQVVSLPPRCNCSESPVTAEEPPVADAHSGAAQTPPTQVVAAPPQQSLLRRIFKPNPPPAVKDETAAAKASDAKPAEAKKEDKTEVKQAQAKKDDKADVIPAQAKAEEKSDDKKPQDKPAAAPARKGFLQRWLAKDDSAAKKPQEPTKPATPPVALPHAGAVVDDPLRQPEVYTKVKLPDSPSPVPAIKAGGSVQLAAATDQPVATVPAPAAPAAPAAAAPPAAPPEAAPGKVPLGMGSIYAARSSQLAPETAKGGNAYPANSVPVAAPNAFTDVPPPAPPQGLQSAFTGVPPQPYPPAMPYGPYPPAMLYGGYPQCPPTYPRPPAPPMPPMDQGAAPGLANAFTLPGITRPIPADMGPPAEIPNAFIDEGAALRTPTVARMPAPAYPPPSYGPPPGYAPAPQPYGGVNRGALLAMLRDSLYPSERETAAEYLACCDWRRDPQVVQALLTAAQSDPAPSVRAGCVRLLGRMHITAAPVVTAVQSLQADPDPRVRLAVEQTLLGLKAP